MCLDNLDRIDQTEAFAAISYVDQLSHFHYFRGEADKKCGCVRRYFLDRFEQEVLLFLKVVPRPFDHGCGR